MLELELKFADHYGKCHPERYYKGICAAVPECPVKPWKQGGASYLPYPGAFVRIVVYALSLALSRRFGCCRLTPILCTQVIEGVIQ